MGRFQIFFLSAFGFLVHSPASAITAPKPFRVTGHFSHSCFLTNGYLPKTATNREAALVYLVDAKGRVRWIYTPAEASDPADPRTRTLFAKPLGNQRIGILRSYGRSYFEVVNLHGKREWSWAPLAADPPEVLHHDFVFSDDTLITFGQRLVAHREPGALNQSPLRYLSTPLVEWDFKKSSRRQLWDFLTTRDALFDKDRSRLSEDQRLFWAGPGLPSAQFNFVHANSFDLVGDHQALVSLRSLNKLALVDLRNQRTIFTVGRAAQNTYRTNSVTHFYRQHHASYLTDGTLLVFDNGEKESRVLHLRLNPQNRSAELIREYRPRMPLYSQRHGSAYLLPNGNLLAFFPHTSSEKSEVNQLIEFSKDTGEEVARMELTWGNSATPYRVVPFPGGCGSPS